MQVSRPISPHPNTRSQWAKWEKIATDYLLRQGYEIIETNWYMRGGEIDIIALDRQQIVFIEVKSRTSRTRWLARESLSRIKMFRFRRSGGIWAHLHSISEGGYRYDFIALQRGRESWKLEHYKNIEMMG